MAATCRCWVTCWMSHRNCVMKAQTQSTPNLPRRGISVVLVRDPFSSSGSGLLSLFYHFQILFPSFLNALLCNLSNVEVFYLFVCFFMCDIYKLTVLTHCRNDCVERRGNLKLTAAWDITCDHRKKEEKRGMGEATVFLRKNRVASTLWRY